MKRYLFAALLMAAPTLVFAQLKVSSNGSVEIGVGNTSSFFDGKLSSKRTDSNGYICSAICGLKSRMEKYAARMIFSGY